MTSKRIAFQLHSTVVPPRIVICESLIVDCTENGMYGIIVLTGKLRLRFYFCYSLSFYYRLTVIFRAVQF